MEHSDVSTIESWHAHVYFDAATREAAGRLCQEAGRVFPLTVGRMHDKPVGPHPRGSCQLAFEPGQFHAIVPWLIENRSGLTVFAHADMPPGIDLVEPVAKLHTPGSGGAVKRRFLVHRHRELVTLFAVLNSR